MPIVYIINSFIIDEGNDISKNDLIEFSKMKLKISSFMNEGWL
jgi:hypothetical protein